MSARLLIIGCGARKLHYPAPAADLYTGPLFRAASGYARASGHRWLILSALYGVVEPSQVLPPYDFTMRDRRRVPADEGAGYATDVRAAILRALPLTDGTVEIHAGAEYVRLIRTLDLQLEIADPLAGLEIGRRLQWYATARMRARGGVA